MKKSANGMLGANEQIEFNVFDKNLVNSNFDKLPWKFSHKITEHPALEISNLEKVVQRLPSEQVYFSSGELKKSDNFDRAHLDHKNEHSLKDAIEDLKNSSSYIMVRSPEVDPSFEELFTTIKIDIEESLRVSGMSASLVDPMLYLFIASPGSVTPFHIDRYSTFLMQIKGSKQVLIYERDNEEVVGQEVAEAFMSQSGSRPHHKEHMEEFASTFDFAEGDSIHIPFMAPHSVVNGKDDISISLSIIFKHKDTVRQGDAMCFNHRARRLGLKPSKAGDSIMKDTMKQCFMKLMRKLK